MKIREQRDEALSQLQQLREEQGSVQSVKDQYGQQIRELQDGNQALRQRAQLLQAENQRFREIPKQVLQEVGGEKLFWTGSSMIRAALVKNMAIENGLLVSVDGEKLQAPIPWSEVVAILDAAAQA